MSVNRLKIAVLSVHSCPLGNLGTKDTGGMSVYIRELAREMGRQGHQVDVYTRYHNQADTQVVELGQNSRLIHLRAGDKEEIDKLAIFPHLPDFTCNLESFRVLNNLQYDLVFSHYWHSAWVGNRLQQWWKVPNISVFHTLAAIKNTFNIGENEPELRIEAEAELIRNSQHIIATTNREKEVLAGHYGASPEQIGVVPCGVNFEIFSPVEKEKVKKALGFNNEKIILFVGRIDPLKGIENLLKAVRCLPENHKTKLVIIGGDKYSQPEIERLKTLCTELQIHDAVTFKGLIEHNELPDYYSAADVCVIPSFYESFGLVALESLACGTPVVANDVGDLKNIIRQGETGFVTTDNSPQSLADKIETVLSWSETDIKSLLHTRASIARYGWSNIASEVIDEFGLVLSGPLTAIR